MSKKKLLIILSALFYLNGLSQETKVKDDIVYRFHYLAPGFSIEKGVFNNFTIIYDITAGFNFQYESVNGESTSTFQLFPSMKLEPRYYLDLDERFKQGKRTDHYSATYTSFVFQIGIPTKSVDNWYSYGVVFGFQKSFMKKGYFDIGIGFGANTIENITNIGIVGNFALGIILN